MAHLIHATAVAIAGRGIVFTGPPGAGKSDLALRLIDGGAATLIADDAVVLEEGLLRAPARTRGKLEVRGVGIITVPHLAKALALALQVDLVSREAVPRLPEYRRGAYDCPCLALHAFDASTPLKIRHAAVQLPTLVQAAS